MLLNHSLECDTRDVIATDTISELEKKNKLKDFVVDTLAIFQLPTI